jgi:hypothetical protein
MASAVSRLQSITNTRVGAGAEGPLANCITRPHRSQLGLYRGTLDASDFDRCQWHYNSMDSLHPDTTHWRTVRTKCAEVCRLHPIQPDIEFLRRVRAASRLSVVSRFLSDHA